MNRVARDAGTVAAVTAVARIVGFLRWIVFAWAVGAPGVGTVYQSVNTVPNIVYEVAVGGILAAVVVPLVAARIGSAGGEHADDVASALLTRTVVVLLPLTLIVAAASPLVSRALLGELGVDGAVGLGTRLLLLFSPQVVLYGLGIVVAGVLQAHRRFLAAALAPLLSSLVVIATYVAWSLTVPEGTSPGTVTTGELLLLGGGTTLGVVVMSVPLLFVAARAGIRLRPRWHLEADTAARARALAGAGVAALIAQQIGVIVTLSVANRSGGDGTLVVQNYVQALYLLPYAVLAVPVATAVFPVLAASVTAPRGDLEAATRTLAGSLRTVVLLSGAAVGGLIAAAQPIGSVFEAIDRDGGSRALDAMPAAILAMAPGLIGFAITAVGLRALYARGRALLAGGVMAIGWLVAAAIPLVVLGPDEGPHRTLVTLGAASSIGMWIAGLGLLARVRHDWGTGALVGLPWSSALAFVGVLAGSLVHLLADGRWPTSVAGATGVGAVAGLAVAGSVLVVGVIADPAVRSRVPGRRGRRADR